MMDYKYFYHDTNQKLSLKLRKRLIKFVPLLILGVITFLILSCVLEIIPQVLVAVIVEINKLN